MLKYKRFIKVFFWLSGTVILFCVFSTRLRLFSNVWNTERVSVPVNRIREWPLQRVDYSTAWKEMKLHEIPCTNVSALPNNIASETMSPFRFRYICASPKEYGQDHIRQIALVQLNENETFHTIWRYAKKHSNIVLLDIGANIGGLSIPLANAVPTARVIAIEPVQKTLRFLTKAIILNQLQEKILLLNNAMYDRPFKTLTMISYAVWLSLGRVDDPLIYKPPDRNNDKVENTVISITFDEIIPLVKGSQKCVVKIDVEGAECIVIRRIDNFLSVIPVPIIIMETNKIAESDQHCIASMLRRLISHGYKPHNGYTGRYFC